MQPCLNDTTEIQRGSEGKNLFEEQLVRLALGAVISRVYIFIYDFSSL